MNSIRTLSIATLAMCLALFGCSKDEKKQDKAAEGTASEVAADGTDTADPGAARTMAAPTTASEAPAPVSGTSAAAAGYDMFRKDMNLVVGINLNSLRSNPAFTMARPMIAAALAKESDGKYGQYTGACGLDPIDAVHSLMVGGVIDGDKDFVLVVSGIDKTRLNKCIEGIGKVAKEEVDIIEDGKLTTYQPKKKDDKPLNVAWLSDATLIVAPELSKETLRERADGKDGMSGNAMMSDMLGKVNNKATFWVVSTPPADKGKDMPIQITGVYGSVELKDGLAIDVGLMSKDEAEAKKGAEALQKKLKEGVAELKGSPFAPMANKFVPKVSVKTEGKYILVNLTLNDAEYKEVLAMAQGFAKMAGGM